MSVRLVIDMNLSVEWVAEFATHGWAAVHWSTVGDPRADDAVIMAWALGRSEKIPGSRAATVGKAAAGGSA